MTIQRLVNVFNDDLAARAWDYLSMSAPWQYGAISQQHSENCIWKTDIMGTPILMEMWDSLQGFLDNKYTLLWASGNGQTAGQNADFHRDSFDGVTHTLIWFANPNWQHGWGGRLIVCQDNSYDEWAFPPMPNSAVFIDARLKHAAEAPHVVGQLRVSVAFKLIEKL